MKVKQEWLQWVLVGIGLWVVGLIFSAFLAPLVATLPLIATIMIPFNWIVFGLVAIELTKLVTR